MSNAAARDVSAETALVDRARRGDVSAFEALYQENLGRVYGLCYRMVGDRAVAEDLTQEAFVRAWRNIGSFEGRSAFSTWLHRLAVHVVLGDMRTRQRREGQVLSFGDLSPHGRPDGRPEARMNLDAAMECLPQGARHVFVLHDVEGYQHEEIAALTGVSVGTSKSQLHRARALLREALR